MFIKTFTLLLKDINPKERVVVLVIILRYYVYFCTLMINNYIKMYYGNTDK